MPRSCDGIGDGRLETVNPPCLLVNNVRAESFRNMSYSILYIHSCQEASLAEVWLLAGVSPCFNVAIVTVENLNALRASDEKISECDRCEDKHAPCRCGQGF